MMIKHKQMTDIVDGDENFIVGKDFETLRPCFAGQGGDMCGKLICAILSKHNPAISDKDVNNDLIKLERDSILLNTMLDIRQRMPVVTLNSKQVDYVLGIQSTINKGRKQAQISRAVDKLLAEKIVFKGKNKKAGFPIFTRLEYNADDENNTLIAEFNYNLLPLVVDLRGKIYSTIPLNEIRLLSSDYAVKIYMLCMEYDKMRNDEYNYKKEITTDDLKECLSISDKYATRDFNKIIEKYTVEISDKTAWKILWDTKRNGRKITKYIFLVTAKNQPQKREFVETIAGRGIDTSLINDENKEIVLYLAKRGVNKKQIFEVYHHYGINYMKFLTEKVDTYYATKIAKEVAYFENDCYYDKLTNKKISYGAIWNGAKRSWLSYDKWAKDNADVIAKEKEQEKLKREADEAIQKQLEQDNIKVEKRNALRKISAHFKNMSDDELDNFINICSLVTNEKTENKEKLINENDRKSLENNDLSSVDKIIVDNFVNDDFDVNKILSHAYSSFYKMEQQRLGFKDFNCFVEAVKEAYYNGKINL